MGRGYRRHNVQGRFRRGRVSGHTVAALNVPLNRSCSARGIAKWFTSINIHTDNYNGVTCDTLVPCPSSARTSSTEGTPRRRASSTSRASSKFDCQIHWTSRRSCKGSVNTKGCGKRAIMASMLTSSPTLCSIAKATYSSNCAPTDSGTPHRVRLFETSRYRRIPRKRAPSSSPVGRQVIHAQSKS